MNLVGLLGIGRISRKENFNPNNLVLRVEEYIKKTQIPNPTSEGNYLSDLRKLKNIALSSPEKILEAYTWFYENHRNIILKDNNFPYKKLLEGIEYIGLLNAPKEERGRFDPSGNRKRLLEDMLTESLTDDKKPTYHPPHLSANKSVGIPGVYAFHKEIY